MNIDIKRLLLVLIGSCIMGIGISLSVMSNLGCDPLTLFWIGITYILPVTIGQANIIVAFCMLVIVFFLDRKQLHIGSLLNPLIIALTTDFLNSFSVQIDSLYGRIPLLVIGFTLLALGIAIYSFADYGKGAYEALVFALITLWKKSIFIIRTSFDILFTILGIILGGSLSIGTILAIGMMGACIQTFMKILSRFSFFEKLHLHV